MEEMKHPLWDRQGAAQQLALSRAVCSVQHAARITDRIRQQNEATNGHPRANIPAMICDADYCVQPIETWGEALVPPCHLCLHYRPKVVQLKEPLQP